MSMLSRVNGWQNGILRFCLLDNTSSSGGGLTGLTPTSSGLIISTITDVEAAAVVYSAAGATIGTIATLGTYVAPTTGQCRFGQVDATNHPGLYELQLLNTRLAVSGASYLIVTVQAGASHCSPQSFLIDLDAQSDIRQVGGLAAPFSGGVLGVNQTQMGGSTTRVTKLGLVLDSYTTGTVTNVSFAPTNTQFECSDITDSATWPVYANRGYVVTAGGLIKSIGVITTDVVGTAGRRFTISALPGSQVFANGDTLIIL